MKSNQALLMFLFVLLLVPPGALATTPPQFSIIPLSGLPNHSNSSSFGYGINESGVIVGQVANNLGYSLVVWENEDHLPPKCIGGHPLP